MNLALITALLTSLNVTVSNPLPEQRNDVPVIIKIPAKAGEIRSASITGGIAYQLDDLNDDGVADELCMLVDLKPSETRNYTVTLSTSPKNEDTEAGTHAYLKLNDKNKKYPEITAISYPGDVDNRQMYNSIYGHGAVLEGLYNAIRVYMDNRQSVDLYAKNKPQLELETTGFYTTAKQLEEGYGRDILWAGTSVAMGSFRGWQNDKPVTIDTVTTRGQRVLADGPLRSIIEVVDKGWVYDGQPLDMIQHYTVYKGHRDYDVEVKLKGAKPGMRFATGVQKIMNDNEGFVESDGLAGSWGNNVPDKGMANVVDTLGLGIAVRAPYLVRTLEDADNYLTILKPDSDGVIRYSITAAALRDETSPRTAKDWFSELKTWKRQKDNPVKVTIGGKGKKRK